jgi:hypothetical protein
MFEIYTDMGAATPGRPLHLTQTIVLQDFRIRHDLSDERIGSAYVARGDLPPFRPQITRSVNHSKDLHLSRINKIDNSISSFDNFSKFASGPTRAPFDQN